MALKIEPLEIEARDGYRLGATLFVPDVSSGRAASVHPATGVPQEYYGRFLPLLSRLLGYVGALRTEDAYARFAAPLRAYAIGRFGFSREAFRATLWRDAADWLVAQ